MPVAVMVAEAVAVTAREQLRAVLQHDQFLSVW
jgi:hypothetical protein